MLLCCYNLFRFISSIFGIRIVVLSQVSMSSLFPYDYLIVSKSSLLQLANPSWQSFSSSLFQFGDALVTVVLTSYLHFFVCITVFSSNSLICRLLQYSCLLQPAILYHFRSFYESTDSAITVFPTSCFSCKQMGSLWFRSS